jgi:CRISPR/Cas system Type II protein with McrA/HNH and RuvC-like nuclease domain
MQNGKCSVTGLFLKANEVHCHHILPRSMGGLDSFDNLTIVHKFIHQLIHAKEKQTIETYLRCFKLTGKQLEKLNYYREQCNLTKIL